MRDVQGLAALMSLSPYIGKLPDTGDAHRYIDIACTWDLKLAVIR